MNPRNFFAELKRRNVYKVAVVYAVTAWLLIQAASILLPTFEAPAWVMKVVVMTVVLGFPLAVILAWAFELTPEGIRRTEHVDVTPGQRSRNRAWIYIVVLAAALSIGLFFLGRHSASAPAARDGASEKSVAVLPFANQSGDPAQEYFSDGVSEELINDLAQIAELRVIGRNSSFQFKGKGGDSRTIGEALGVANLLEGSVRKAGDRVRISVELVDTTNRTQRWSKTFDRELKDIFAVQSEIARAVADQLRVTLLGEQRFAVAQPSNRNVEAYNAYLQGEYYNRTGNPEGLTKAIEFFDEAIRRDPNYAEAYAHKSLAWAQIAYLRGAKGREEWEQARQAAKRAVALKPDLERAHGALAYVYINDWNLAAAEAELKKITATEAWTGGNMFAVLRFCQGRVEEAIDLQKRAIEADPVFALWRRNLAVLCITAGRFDEAERELRKAIELQPRAVEFHLALVELALLRNQPEVAFHEAQLEPTGVLHDLAVALACGAQPDRKQEADAALDHFIQDHGEEAPFRIALIYAYRNEREKVFEWLDRAYALHDPRLIRLLTTPFLRPYHSDPRFASLCRKLDLPPPQ
ncbi:MAG: tetratricopeptide repeat protein [Chthoniobacterales bacterium]